MTPTASTINAPLTASEIPRRILHVMNAAGGGAAISTLELIRKFRTFGIDSSIVCNDTGTPSELQALTESVEGRLLIRPLYWWNRKIRATAWKRPLLELLQLKSTGCLRASTADVASFAALHDVDLIHSNTSLTLEGGRAAQQLGLPHIWHFRELIGPRMPFRFPKEGADFGRYVAELATFVVANSHATAAAIASLLPADLLRIVPNGIDVDKFLGLPQHTGKEKLVVGMVANLTSGIKKHDVFLEAAAQVSHALPVEFRLYGRLPTKPTELNRWHERIASLGLGDRLRLAGFVSDTQQIMAEIDVLVHTSEFESFGRVAVEAMAAGRAVIGVAGGGLREIVVDQVTGFLCPTNAPEELAKSIERLAQDREFRECFGTQGRARALSDYTIDRCATDLLRVYQEAIAKHGRRPCSIPYSAASKRRDAGPAQRS